MGARSKARKHALDVLFEADQRGTDPVTTLRERSGQAQVPFGEYAYELVEGVSRNRGAIDRVIADHAEGWTLDRMPAVDRVVLRVGAYELLYAPDVPPGVAISEAVELARELSTDASPGFVNGVLATIARAPADRLPARAEASEDGSGRPEVPGRPDGPSEHEDRDS